MDGRVVPKGAAGLRREWTLTNFPEHIESRAAGNEVPWIRSA
jgi:hypothetical protein